MPGAVNVNRSTFDVELPGLSNACERWLPIVASVPGHCAALLAQAPGLCGPIVSTPSPPGLRPARDRLAWPAPFLPRFLSVYHTGPVQDCMINQGIAFGSGNTLQARKPRPYSNREVGAGFPRPRAHQMRSPCMMNLRHLSGTATIARGKQGAFSWHTFWLPRTGVRRG
jgi:hypothetical protein